MCTAAKIVTAIGVIGADTIRDVVGTIVPFGMAAKSFSEKKPVKGILWTTAAIAVSAWVIYDNASGEARDRCTRAICKFTSTSVDPNVDE